jgi:hypothetical protein
MRRAIPVVLLWLQLQFGALRVLERLPGVVGDIALAVVWVASAVGLWVFLRRPPRWRILTTPWPTATLVLLVTICALAVYPAVDDRRATGGGSDADDAVVLVVQQIRDGADPFARDTYLGSPPTTGPGSVLWAAPFPGRHTYAAGVVLALAATLGLLRRWWGGWEVPSLTALLLGASVPFWEGVAQGNDHLAMSCGLAILVAGVRQTDGSDGLAHTRGWRIWAFALLAAVLGTWRAAYLHLPLLLAIGLWPRSRRNAIVMGGVGLGIALLLHGVLLSWTDGWDAYDPVQQLIVKSDEDLGAGGRAFVLVATLIGAVVALAEARERRPDVAVLVLAAIGAPLGGIAIAGAVAADEPAAWSEASYLLPTLVLAAVVAACSVVETPAPAVESAPS